MHGKYIVNCHTVFIKLTIAIVVIKKLHLVSSDVTQKYLQSDRNLSRKVYIKPCRIFGLLVDKLLLPNKPFYGLDKSGDYWDPTPTRRTV